MTKPDFEKLARDVLPEMLRLMVNQARNGDIEKLEKSLAAHLQSAFALGEEHNAINDHKDYQEMMERFSRFLDHATGGKMSKTNYSVEAMCVEMEAHVTELTDEAYEQGRRDERKRCEKIADDIVVDFENRIKDRRPHDCNWGARAIGARDVRTAIRNLGDSSE